MLKLVFNAFEVQEVHRFLSNCADGRKPSVSLFHRSLLLSRFRLYNEKNRRQLALDDVRNHHQRSIDHICTFVVFVIFFSFLSFLRRLLINK